MIAGPAGTNICSECVDLCGKILAEKRAEDEKLAEQEEHDNNCKICKGIIFNSISNYNYCSHCGRKLKNSDD